MSAKNCAHELSKSKVTVSFQMSTFRSYGDANRRQAKSTLVDFQLDAQNSYSFTYDTFIKILYMFRALPSSSSGGLRRNCVYVAAYTQLRRRPPDDEQGNARNM